MEGLRLCFLKTYELFQTELYFGQFHFTIWNFFIVLTLTYFALRGFIALFKD